MKTNNLIIKLITLLFIFVSSGWAGYTVSSSKYSLSVEKEVHPNVFVRAVKNKIVSSAKVYARASSSGVRFYFDYPSHLLNKHTKAQIFIYSSSGSMISHGSSFTLSNSGGTKSLYSNKSFNGNYKIKIALLYKDTSGGGYLLVSRGSINIKKQISIPSSPSISSVSPTTSTSITSGDNVKFTAYLSKSLPSGYSVSLLIDGASERSMSCSGRTCTSYRIINSTGTNRKYAVYVKYKGSTKKTKFGYYNVKEKKEKQYSPTLSSSGNSSIKQGSSYALTLRMEDRNSNLKTIQINWNDGSSLLSQSVQRSSNHSKTYYHTFTKSGTFTITAKIIDHTGRIDNISKTITVTSNLPSSPSN